MIAVGRQLVADLLPRLAGVGRKLQALRLLVQAEQQCLALRVGEIDIDAVGMGKLPSRWKVLPPSSVLNGASP